MRLWELLTDELLGDEDPNELLQADDWPDLTLPTTGWPPAQDEVNDFFRNHLRGLAGYMRTTGVLPDTQRRAAVLVTLNLSMLDYPPTSGEVQSSDPPLPSPQWVSRLPHESDEDFRRRWEWFKDRQEKLLPAKSPNLDKERDIWRRYAEWFFLMEFRGERPGPIASRDVAARQLSVDPDDHRGVVDIGIKKVRKLLGWEAQQTE